MGTRQVFGWLLAVVFAAGGLYGFHFMSQDGVIAILVLPLLAVWIAAGKALVEWLVGNDWSYQHLRATRVRRQKAAQAPATKPERQLRREISIPGLIERPGFGWRLLIEAAALAQGLVRSLRAAARRLLIEAAALAQGLVRSPFAQGLVRSLRAAAKWLAGLIR